MLPPLEYLAWAIEHYAFVRYDLATSGLKELAADAVATPAELLAGVTDPRSPRMWVEAIARRFGVDPAEAVATHGTTHGLWSTYAALLSPGDEVLVESPAYEPLMRIAEGMSAHVTFFDRDPSEGWALDPDRVARAITKRTRLVVVSNLHNPTGAYANDAAIAAVAEVVRRAGAQLVVDEVYRDLIDYDAHVGATAFRLGPDIITTSSLTKVYGLGWARAGWVLAPRRDAARIRAATLHDAGGISYALASMGRVLLERIGAAHAISLAARSRDEEAAAILRSFIDARPHLRWTRQPGSVFGFVTDSRGKDLRPTIERAVAEEQVIVAPGSFFRAPAGFRVRYGALPLDVLAEGCDRLGRALDRG